MATSKRPGQDEIKPFGAKRDDVSPPWADGLKQLYDDVVDEPIPDAFKDLLNQLDASGDDDGGNA